MLTCGKLKVAMPRGGHVRKGNTVPSGPLAPHSLTLCLLGWYSMEILQHQALGSLTHHNLEPNNCLAIPQHGVFCGSNRNGLMGAFPSHWGVLDCICYAGLSVLPPGFLGGVLGVDWGGVVGWEHPKYLFTKFASFSCLSLCSFLLAQDMAEGALQMRSRPDIRM